jgi:hypothetical protein
MKPLFLTLLLATLCAATGYGQTIKALGYDTTNGQIVYLGTNTLAFTNEFISIDSTLRGLQTTNSTLVLNNGEFFGPWFFDEAVGFGDIGGTRANLELAEEDEVRFASVLVGSDSTNSVAIGISSSGISIEGATASPNVFEIIGETLGAKIRADFGIPLPALTNTNNADTMRALAGSTNTNEPFSGSVVVDTNTLVFTNGILLEVTTP